jgi:protein-S-isoprenylcysteine O-methyltransferase Ste14
LGTLDKGPGVKVPPPLICLFMITAGYWLNFYYPVVISLPEFFFFIGLFLILGAVFFALIAVYQFWRAKTHIEPWKPASSLMLDGVFAYSRNPIYLSFIIVTLGIGLFFSNIWILFSTGPLLIALYLLVVKKEELYLERVFGDQYVDYKKRVRRWL